jgi:hypothetical protein
VIRLLTEEDSWMWQITRGGLQEALYEEASTGAKWALGFHPPGGLEVDDYAGFLECALEGMADGGKKQRRAWEHAGSSVEGLNLQQRWKWIDEFYQRGVRSFMDAGDMMDSSKRVKAAAAFEDFPGPAVRGHANFMPFHNLEPAFANAGIANSFADWEVRAKTEWQVWASEHPQPSATLPAAGIVTPYTEQAYHATPLRWVMALGGC